MSLETETLDRNALTDLQLTRLRKMLVPILKDNAFYKGSRKRFFSLGCFFRGAFKLNCGLLTMGVSNTHKTTKKC